MKPTKEDFELLKLVYDGGVHVDGLVDQRRYKRLEDLGWITGTSVNLSDVAYRVTPEGAAKAAGVR
jgi:ribosome-associated protein YbcJ (S4-like RNA binding protein)